MNSDLEELAKRAVECGRWRWLAGMAAYMTDSAHQTAPYESLHDTRVRTVGNPWQVDGAASERIRVAVGDERPILGTVFTSALLPDLTDPATLGCVLALVREAYDDHTATLEWAGCVDEAGDQYDEWTACVFVSTESESGEGPSLDSERYEGYTEGAALVAALEAAP